MKAFFIASLFPSLYKNIPQDSAGNYQFNSIYLFPIVIANIIEILLALVGVLAMIYITYSGIQYIMSEGNSTKIAAAKTSITNAIIGLVLASAAYLIIDFIAGRFS